MKGYDYRITDEFGKHYVRPPHVRIHTNLIRDPIDHLDFMRTISSHGLFKLIELGFVVLGYYMSLETDMVLDLSKLESLSPITMPCAKFV